MGAGLVMAAYEVAARMQLDHAPTRVFVYMAATAVDADPQPVFFGGRDALAGALGAPADSNGYRAVERAVNALSRRGAVAVESKGAPGRNTRYRLRDGASPLAPNARRSASPDVGTPDAERPVSNQEHPTLSGRTPDAERYEHPTLSVGLRRKEEHKEEGPPSRFCLNHPNGTSAPCGACGDARRVADAWKPPSRPARTHLHQFDEVSGYCGCGVREDAA